MSPEQTIKLAIYEYFVREGRAPSPEEVARTCGLARDRVLAAYAKLREQRVLVLESAESIRMAPPFSGVPTQHEVRVDGRTYFANCAWDALGIPAALRRPGEVRSRCEASGEPLRLRIERHGPEPSSWLFHCVVPASKWWDDIVFT